MNVLQSKTVNGALFFNTLDLTAKSNTFLA